VADSARLPVTLSGWLAYIEALHPKTIEMGLTRVSTVAKRLNLTPSFPIITVAGTNGKGSTCAMLSQIYIRAGYKVGCYTSPHLIRYNERVKINGLEISDESLCEAFSAVEKARGDVALTYFEMGTLAAMWHFLQQKIEVAVLEVGLGGRLDAVNVFEPDCCIVTSVDLDHMDYLGDTRELIGLEKAGIFRAEKPAICGDAQPPSSLRNHAEQIGADLQCIGEVFYIVNTDAAWRYQDADGYMDLPLPRLQGDFQLNNAACALRAAKQMNAKLPVTQVHIEDALNFTDLAGRFQQLQSHPEVILDVAHNPHAADSLARNLATHPCQGRTVAVFAMLSDKDIDGVIRSLLPYISVWYVAGIDAPRGESAENLQRRLSALGALSNGYSSVDEAFEAAYQAVGKNDRIIVFGSFYTVAAAMARSQANARPTSRR